MIGPVNSIPISTQLLVRGGEKTQGNVVPSQENPELATPETVNKQVNTAIDQYANYEQNQSEQKTAVRSAALDYSYAQRQQDLVNQYIEQSTDIEIEDENSLSLDDAIELAQRNQRAQQIETVSNLASNDALQERVDRITLPEAESRFRIQV